MPRLFVDVDDTLILYDKAGPNPYGVYQGTSYSINERLVEGIRQFAKDNPDELIVIWSGGGKQYAQHWAENLHISHLITPMDKGWPTINEFVRDGDIMVDDMPTIPKRTHAPDEWPEEVS